MKKRYIAATGFALLAVAAVAGRNVITAQVEACNAGDTKACGELVEVTSAHDEITNPDFQTILAAHELRAANEAKKANKWQPTSYNVSILAVACENQIKPALKDPRSFRRLDEGMSDLTDSKVTVFVNYTATNSFGGRIKNTHSCTYTR